MKKNQKPQQIESSRGPFIADLFEFDNPYYSKNFTVFREGIILYIIQGKPIGFVTKENSPEHLLCPIKLPSSDDSTPGYTYRTGDKHDCRLFHRVLSDFMDYDDINEDSTRNIDLDPEELYYIVEQDAGVSHLLRQREKHASIMGIDKHSITKGTERYVSLLAKNIEDAIDSNFLVYQYTETFRNYNQHTEYVIGKNDEDIKEFLLKKAQWSEIASIKYVGVFQCFGDGVTTFNKTNSTISQTATTNKPEVTSMEDGVGWAILYLIYAVVGIICGFYFVPEDGWLIGLLKAWWWPVFLIINWNDIF